MSSTRGARVGVSLFLGAAALTLSACGESTIEPGPTQQFVADLVAKQTQFTPEDVTCPDGIEAQVGVEFECAFTGPEGTGYLAHLKVVEVNGKEATFDLQELEPTE
ncbi:DUF4333 domain-containing protein [Mycolicibacterium arabiense]|jgi:hypothetical protein|nr:DUF4333 domain-containing protein [Mycolicibacterium arabiense]MCV7373343.1 DUF4333 domain-containing protein [Mycolicibacterium arabiense]